MSLKLKDDDVKTKLASTVYVFDSDEYAHITINEKICEKCPHHFCMVVCPAECYELVEGKIKFHAHDCVECGSCFIACDQGSVTWNNPRGSFGVKYLYG